LEKDFKPISFDVRELYLLTRVGADPFDVSLDHILYLGPKKFEPSFGLGTSQVGSVLERSLALVGLPVGKINSDLELEELCKNLGIKVLKVELMLQANLKPRPLAVLEFDSKEQADEVRVKFNNVAYQDYTIYLKALECMTYPDVVGGSASRAKFNKIL